MHMLKCTKINGELCGCAFQSFDTLAHFTSFLDSSSRLLILDKVCKLVLQVVFYSIGQKSPTAAGSNDAWFLMCLFLTMNCLVPLQCPLTTYSFPLLPDSEAKGRMSLDRSRAMHMLTGQPPSDEQSKSKPPPRLKKPLMYRLRRLLRQIHHLWALHCFAKSK